MLGWRCWRPRPEIIPSIACRRRGVRGGIGRVDTVRPLFALGAPRAGRSSLPLTPSAHCHLGNMNSQQWPPARAKIQQHTDRRARNLTTLSTQGRSQLYRATRAWRDSARESSFRSITPNASSFQVNPMGFLCTSIYSSIYIICHIHVCKCIYSLGVLDHCFMYIQTSKSLLL